MSDAAAGITAEIQFDADGEWHRLERAVAEADYESPAAFVREGALRLVDEILDEDGCLECPHDDCDRTFATRRELRGHLGSSEHALDIPEGDFWCGYCGYGPTSWRGVNAHHGSSNHDGDPIRLDEEPDRDDLVAPEDIPDHKNPELLERLYQKHGGNYTELCRQHDFDVTPGRVRHYLIEFGIHKVTPQGPSEDGDGPAYRDREWLQERYDAANGNISEMHRRIEAEDDVDVTYRTLQKNLKSLGIHDPTESPGRSQGWEQRDAREPDDPEIDETEEVDADESEPTSPDADSEPAPSPAEEPVVDEADGAAEDEPEADIDEVLQSIRGVDSHDNVESFDDLVTPDWLDEASFHAAVDMAADVDELADTLGWAEHDRLQAMVELLDVDIKVDGGDGE